MAIQIEANKSATAFHITDGAVLFPYAIDAQHAVANHPLEWSGEPWTREAADAARKQLQERHQREVDLAKARGLPEPIAPIAVIEPAPLTDEDQAAIDAHNQAVADAAERLKAYYAEKAKEKEVADQVAADEALVKQQPPVPAAARRPTPAQIRKLAAETDEERAARLSGEQAAAEKADADRLAGNTPSQDFQTTT